MNLASIERKNESGSLSELIPVSVMENYSDILRKLDLPFISANYYWQVGAIEKTQGWILHISVISTQVMPLFKTVIPCLLAEGVAFKIPKDPLTAQYLLEGTLGYIHLAKIMSIYPNDDKAALSIALQLIQLTKPFRGPIIPTDLCLGGTVYTRYGVFNPCMAQGPQGEVLPCIYDSKGQLIPDPYTIPFRLPEGIDWPFGELASPVPPKGGKLLNDRYYPVATIKPDVKGAVIKALYIRKPWSIKACLIKQGRQNMIVDEYGRGIRERLRWQYDLHNHLSGEIPLPKILDYFEQAGDSYLVMEFIKGITLTEWIRTIFGDRSWQDLSNSDQLQLVNQLNKLLLIIHQLHEKGYIHRDITPDNFLIDKKGEINLIDIELAWSSQKKEPTPPFKLGTPGFMSPEQFNQQTPTVKEDIFAVGGLLWVFFTNLPPLKIATQPPEVLYESVLFFLKNEEMARLIANCRNPDPRLRPSMSILLEEVQLFEEQLKSTLSKVESSTNGLESFSTDLQSIIQSGIRGLSHPQLVTQDLLWLSRIQRNEAYIGNEQSEMSVYEGWHTGVAGPLWLVAKAKINGYDIDTCEQIYFHNWEHVVKNTFETIADSASGLYGGKAGLALALAAGIDSHLLQPSKENLGLLERCFSQQSAELSLANGLAGQGMALLSCTQWMESVKVESLFATYIAVLLNQQQSDGSWKLYGQTGKKDDILTGLSGGVAGIAWFLLIYQENYPSQAIEEACLKAMTWLIHQARKSGNTYTWLSSTKTRLVENSNSNLEISNIVLVFIQAYKVLRNPIYRKIAEACLQNVPEHLTSADYSLETGLARLGELYLEAANVFNNAQWIQRAHWITGVMLHSCQYHEQGETYWFIENTQLVTADLFTGNSGILHFFMRYHAPQKIGHPLLPFRS